MANPDIARCACPICNDDSALRETSKRKAYIVCENCGVQIFARGSLSDRLLRVMGGADSQAWTLARAALQKILRGMLGGAGETGKPVGVAGKPAATVPPPAKPAPEKAAPVTVRRHTSEGETITETQQVQQPGEAGEETPLLDFLLNLGGGKK